MWIKLCLLLVYICFLFLLSRFLEAISWCDPGSSAQFSRKLLDPMRLSVAKLKCLLDHRGVNYDSIVEKSELTTLIEATGPVDVEDVNVSCQEDSTLPETNFTSGAHFIEEVEDAKDSVWLVQVVTHSDQVKVLMNQRWKNIQRKASYFGLRTGFLDCSLDERYCHRKGWKVPMLLLALPSLFEKKANVVMYNYFGPGVESSIMNWIHEKLDSKVDHFTDISEIPAEESSTSLTPELRAILLTHAVSAPLFFSALSVKFPGRVKFGIVTVESSKAKTGLLKRMSKVHKQSKLPLCVVQTAERNYTYGLRPSERFSFSKMEIFFKFLYPCLNDIFILSFIVANVISWFELFVSNCGLFKRLRKFIWCVLKYNLIVITLWLPVIGIFQMPHLDKFPLLLLKLHRIFTTSDLGSVLRGDYVFFINNPLYVYLSFVVYLILVTLLCKKYRDVEEDSDDWFNFRHMQTLTHLGSNNLFDPRRTSSYDLVGGMEVFGARFSAHSLWLQPSIPLEYIQHLPTWRYTPQSLASRAAQNTVRIEYAMGKSASGNLQTGKTETNPESGCACVKKRTGSLSENNPASVSSSSGVSKASPFVTSCHDAHGSSSENPKLLEQGDFPHSCDISNCQSSAQPNSKSCNNCQTQSGYQSPVLESTASTSSQSLCEEIAGSAVPSSQSVSVTHTSPDLPSQQAQSDVLPNGFRKGYMESLQCVICLDEYAPLTMLCGLPCGHVFHETCIISWLNLEKHFCPMCRWPSYKLMSSQSP